MTLGMGSTDSFIVISFGTKYSCNFLQLRTENETIWKERTFSLTFSKDDGETTEKQTKNTSVCGYDKGLNRS